MVTEHTSPQVGISKHHKFLITTATYSAVVVAALLIGAKSFAWMLTSSLSLQASLIDSLLDMVTSIMNLLVVRQALKPADAEHRFGHGKAEALGGLGQSAFIAGSAVWLIIDALHRLVSPRPLQESGTGSIVMLIAIVLTLLLVLYQRYVIKQTRSLAISADSLHYVGDLYTNIGVLISLNVSVLLGWTRLDSLVGAGIAGYILYTSWSIGRRSLDVLMDRELPDKARLRIMEIALKDPRVWGVHDLRTRSAGLQDFIQMHLDMDEKLSLLEAHDVANTVELALQEAFPHAEIIIHQDPLPYRGAMAS
ncbi:MAG: fieF [Alphaproteobacteria bacterium]|jgi:ferrous-iron efflux pump FieF|nr:fieF [Alphaproteobacteria bacterium]